MRKPTPFLAYGILTLSALLTSNSYADATTAPATFTPAEQHVAASAINWDQYKGKVVLIDFWASWCGPCRESFPWMKQMQAKYAKDGLVIITINTDQKQKLADAFISQYKPNFSVFFDPKGVVASQFKVEGMPSAYLMDRQGKPVSKHIGFFKAKQSEYEQQIVSLLKK